MKTQNNRYWEIDFVRGIAVVMMVVYHFLYDYKLVSGSGIDHKNFGWLIYVHITAGLFVLLVGLSLTLSFSRAKPLLSPRALRLKFIKRGLGILCLGFVITAATWIAFPKGKVLFGILHLIGVSIILCHPLADRRIPSLLLAGGAIGLGICFRGILLQTPWLLCLGIRPHNFYTMDYFPLFPWVGPVLLGVFLGNLLYPKGNRAFVLPDRSRSLLVRKLCLTGRHSLMIYLVHQPILVGTMHLVRWVASRG